MHAQDSPRPLVCHSSGVMLHCANVHTYKTLSVVGCGSCTQLYRYVCGSLRVACRTWAVHRQKCTQHSIVSKMCASDWMVYWQFSVYTSHFQYVCLAVYTHTYNDAFLLVWLFGPWYCTALTVYDLQCTSSAPIAKCSKYKIVVQLSWWASACKFVCFLLPLRNAIVMLEESN